MIFVGAFLFCFDFSILFVHTPQHLGFLGLLLSGFSLFFYPLNFYLSSSVRCDPNQGSYKEKPI